MLATSDTEADDARRDIATLLERLPDRQRLPIVHMKTRRPIGDRGSAATGMSESAVKVGVHRGLKALAAMMRGNDGY